MRPRSTSRLVYDSARSDALLGLRSAVFVNRTLVFQGGALSLDLVIHAASGGNGYAHGQVIDAASNRPVPEARVRLRSTDSPVRTDGLGQFALAIADQDRRLGLEVETEAVTMLCVVPHVDSYPRHSVA